MTDGKPLHKREPKGKLTHRAFNSKGKPIIVDPTGGYMHQQGRGPKQRIAPRKERRRLARLEAKIAKERIRAGINTPHPDKGDDDE